MHLDRSPATQSFSELMSRPETGSRRSKNSVPKIVTGSTPFFLQLNAFGSLQNLMSMATWIAHSSGTPPPSLSRLPPQSAYSLHSPSKPSQSMTLLDMSITQMRGAASGNTMLTRMLKVLVKS